MCGALVFVSIATTLVATVSTVCALRERRGRRKAETMADYFYNKLYRPTERQLEEALDRICDLEGA